MNPHTNNAGANFATKRQVAPAVYTPQTVSGAAIDRSLIGMPMSCKLVGNSGAVTGSSAAINLDDSADGSAWAAYVPPRSPTGATPGVAADAQLAAIAVANTLVEKNIDLSSARKFIRATAVVSGGTSMALEVHVVVAAGDTLPQT